MDSAINDIVIGGFSSTFVALLIAWHDNRKIAQEKQRISERVTEPFYLDLFYYLSRMEQEFFGKKLTDLKNCNAISSDIFKGEDGAAGVDEWEYRSLVGIQDSIAKEADEILDKEIELINEKIISAEDIDTIRNLRRSLLYFEGEMENRLKEELHYPKLFFRHNGLLSFLENDSRYRHKLTDYYLKFYEKYQHVINNRIFFVLDYEKSSKN